MVVTDMFVHYHAYLVVVACATMKTSWACLGLLELIVSLIS